MTLVRRLFVALMLLMAGTVAGFADDVLQVPDSGNLVDFRGQDGSIGTFRVTGAQDGRVFGSGVYTDDSDLATAAVHAGLVGVGQTRDLRVEILAGKSGYRGSSSHGVNSEDYGQWEGSFEFLDKPAAAPAATGAPDPGNLEGYRAQVGQTMSFAVRGKLDGSVYGDGTYTDDSSLATAAVHAGLLVPGQAGVVEVQILPGQPAYEGASRNGVDSREYGAWQGSFRFTASPQMPVMPADAIVDPVTLTAYRSHVGQVFHFAVTGNANGTVYGDGIYTDDTHIATAAVHAGVLRDGQPGIVSVMILPGQTAYKAAERNGVSSLSYGAWDGSYQFVK